MDSTLLLLVTGKLGKINFASMTTSVDVEWEHYKDKRRTPTCLQFGVCHISTGIAYWVSCSVLQVQGGPSE